MMEIRAYSVPAGVAEVGIDLDDYVCELLGNGLDVAGMLDVQDAMIKQAERLLNASAY